MMETTAFECNAPDVVFENFGDEVILLNLKTGRYFSLDPLGMVCWDYLSQRVPPAAVIERISGAYSAEPAGRIPADIRCLLEEFLAQHLLRPSAQPAVGCEAADASKLPPAYAPPSLTTFDDITEMLLLDPVHDVADVGWPHPPAPAATEHGVKTDGTSDRG
jgi:Coenzyme PQQ synthesis protein D (PqqD)